MNLESPQFGGLSTGGFMASGHGRSISQLPIVPDEVLKRYQVHERYDDRLKACARLLQALWLRARDIPMGTHQGRDGRARRLGSRLSSAAAAAGRNFLTPRLATMAQQVLAYQESGAFMPAERVLANSMSSTTLCLQVMLILAQDLGLAARVFQRLLPDQDIGQVSAIRFEHSLGRRDPSLTADNTAHDCVVHFIRRRRSRHAQRHGVVAMESKYTEGLYDSAPCQPGRYDDLAEASGLFKEPYHAALRVNPLQQLFREHLLAQAAVMRGDWPSAVFVSVAPAANARVQRQAELYRAFLNHPVEGQVPFAHLTLDTFIDAIGAAGAPAAAAALFERYIDWGRIDELVSAALDVRIAKWPGAKRRPVAPPKLIAQAA
jgi:hypothetical protein